MNKLEQLTLKMIDRSNALYDDKAVLSCYDYKKPSEDELNKIARDLKEFMDNCPKITRSANL